MFLPPGYIHAVITVGYSAMLTLSLIREDWLEAAEMALPKEVAFFEEQVRKYKEPESAEERRVLKERIDLITNRWMRDSAMLHRLLEEDLHQEDKLRLDKILEIGKKVI